MSALYAEAGGHVAKRPRVDFTSITTSAAAATGNGHHHHHVSGMTSPVTSGGYIGGGNMSQQYIEAQLNRKSQEPEKPNHILLFTVLNPTYPITCDVLHTICSPHGGKVLRIVIFKKNGVQAMVEFDCLESAKTAKENLHGCDIYSGCCTLKIEYAKPTKLNVYKNDTESYDYTNPNLGKTAHGMGADGMGGSNANAASTLNQRRVLIKAEPAMQNRVVAAAAAAGSNLTSNGLGGQMGGAAAATAALAAGQQAAQNPAATYENGLAAQISAAGIPTAATIEVLNSTPAGATVTRLPSVAVTSANLLRAGANAGAPILSAPLGTPAGVAGVPVNAPAGVAAATVANGTQGYQQQGSVCMVYGLNTEKMNCSRLFNLFCLYGNVVRIKFLKTKEGCAMVQMGEGSAVERALTNLNNTNFFGTKMQLGYSKQAFLADVQSPYQLADGTPSFQDFMGSKNNRFINPEMASKNRIQPPSKILHFFNTPPGLEASDVETLFTSHGSPTPKCVKMFPSKTERSSSGLIEFESLPDALEGLVTCNHQPVPNPNGKFPYIMKLCFSSSRSIPTTIR